LRHYPRLDRVLPAMGYSPAQLEDLRMTIGAVDCDTIIIASPVDLARLIKLPKPACRVSYDLAEISPLGLSQIITDFVRNRVALRTIGAPAR
jgi:predicted GTPase